MKIAHAMMVVQVMKIAHAMMVVQVMKIVHAMMVVQVMKTAHAMKAVVKVIQTVQVMKGGKVNKTRLRRTLSEMKTPQLFIIYNPR